MENEIAIDPMIISSNVKTSTEPIDSDLNPAKEDNHGNRNYFGQPIESNGLSSEDEMIVTGENRTGVDTMTPTTAPQSLDQIEFRVDTEKIIDGAVDDSELKTTVRTSRGPSQIKQVEDDLDPLEERLLDYDDSRLLSDERDGPIDTQPMSPIDTVDNCRGNIDDDDDDESDYPLYTVVIKKPRPVVDHVALVANNDLLVANGDNGLLSEDDKGSSVQRDKGIEPANDLADFNRCASATTNDDNDYANGVNGAENNSSDKMAEDGGSNRESADELSASDYLDATTVIERLGCRIGLDVVASESNIGCSDIGCFGEENSHHDPAADQNATNRLSRISESDVAMLVETSTAIETSVETSKLEKRPVDTFEFNEQSVETSALDEPSVEMSNFEKHSLEPSTDILQELDSEIRSVEMLERLEESADEARLQFVDKTYSYNLQTIEITTQNENLIETLVHKEQSVETSSAEASKREEQSVIISAPGQKSIETSEPKEECLQTLESDKQSTTIDISNEPPVIKAQSIETSANVEQSANIRTNNSSLRKLDDDSEDKQSDSDFEEIIKFNLNINHEVKFKDIVCLNNASDRLENRRRNPSADISNSNYDGSTDEEVRESAVDARNKNLSKTTNRINGNAKIDQSYDETCQDSESASRNKNLSKTTNRINGNTKTDESSEPSAGQNADSATQNKNLAKTTNRINGNTRTDESDDPAAEQCQERGFPEKGNVKVLLAQWRLLEKHRTSRRSSAEDEEDADLNLDNCDQAAEEISNSNRSRSCDPNSVNENKRSNGNGAIHSGTIQNGNCMTATSLSRNNSGKKFRWEVREPQEFFRSSPIRKSRQ